MNTKRILIVDDESTIVELLREVLIGQGHDVDAAANATEALGLVRQNIYDAAILDFDLPDMNGVMLHHEIRQMDEELAGKTLFMSGLAQSEKNLDYYTAFGKGFLPKPFEPHQVLNALGALWDGDAG